MEPMGTNHSGLGFRALIVMWTRARVGLYIVLRFPQDGQGIDPLCWNSNEPQSVKPLRGKGKCKSFHRTTRGIQKFPNKTQNPKPQPKP